MYIETLEQRNDKSVIEFCRHLAEQFRPQRIDESQFDVLKSIANILARESDALAEHISRESHRPISLCLTECQRAVETVKKTMDAVRVLAKPTVLDFSNALQSGAWATAERFSFSPLFAIVPFNFPLNLAFHKLAPALALEIPFVCKPPSQHIGLWKRVHDLLIEAGVDGDRFLVWAAKADQVEAVLESIPFGLVSFTGSTKIGLQLKEKFPRRRFILELGGTAACFVVDSPNLEAIAGELAKSAFGQAGQSCISTQHIFVEEGTLEVFSMHLKAATEKLSLHTAPDDKDTVCSALVDEKSFQKTQNIIQNARVFGFEIFQASETTRQPHYIPPTILFCEDASQISHAEIDFLREEFFSPVVTVIPFRKLDDAIAVCKRFDANIHASAYTQDQLTLRTLFLGLPTRSLLHNMPPSWRADEMPYGGTDKLWPDFPNIHSGLIGNEGPLQTLTEYTIDRLLVEKIEKAKQ